MTIAKITQPISTPDDRPVLDDKVFTYFWPTTPRSKPLPDLSLAAVLARSTANASAVPYKEPVPLLHIRRNCDRLTSSSRVQSSASAAIMLSLLFHHHERETDRSMLAALQLPQEIEAPSWKAKVVCTDSLPTTRRAPSTKLGV